MVAGSDHGCIENIPIWDNLPIKTDDSSVIHPENFSTNYFWWIFQHAMGHLFKGGRW
jgi:hypothetical protein